MQECCIFLNAFGPFSTLTPSGPKFLYNHTVGADARHRPVLAPEGSIGEKQKSVKNRAALLHGLAFLLLNLLFGVLRGEQPLRRASRAFASSGHFFRFLFGCPKRKAYSQDAVIKKGCRRVATLTNHHPQNSIKFKLTSQTPFPSRAAIKSALRSPAYILPHFAKKVRHIKAFRFYRM